MDQTPKPFWHSKTFWMNVIMISMAILNEVQGWDFLPEGSGEYLIGAIAILNIVLRFLTSQPITLTREKY